MNLALERAPVLTLLCFVALDIGSALCLWGGFEATQAAVDADFALAYALSKAVRVQRLALDAAAAGALAKAWPALAAVRVSRLVDAAAALPGRVATLLPASVRARLPGSGSTAPGEPDKKQPAAKRALSRTADEARRMADTYGLAIMAAKNVIGPVSIVLIYAALQQGVDVQSWLHALGGGGAGGGIGAAGRTAGRMALASWTSIVFFPAIVLGAAHLSLALDAAIAARRAPKPADR